MRADKEKMVNLWLGKIIATLKGYTLENYPFDFTGDNFRRDKSGKTDAAWKLLNGIRTRGLSPRMLLRLILLSPTILLILVRLNINAFVTAYLTRNFYYTLPETKRRDFLMKNIWGGNPGKNCALPEKNSSTSSGPSTLNSTTVSLNWGPATAGFSIVSPKKWPASVR